MENTFSNPLTEYDCAGFHGNQCGQPNARWRHRFRATWHSNFKLNVSLGWRHIGSTMNDDGSDNPNLANPALVPSWEANDSLVIPAGNFVDLSAAYSFQSGVDLVVGVNNILDKDPPLLPSNSSTGFLGTYDPLGRSVYTTLRFAF